MTSRFDTRALGTTLLRLIVGITFIAHGWQKLFAFGLAGTAGFLGSVGVPHGQRAGARCSSPRNSEAVSCWCWAC